MDYDKRKEDIRNLRAQYYTVAEIGKMYDITRQRVAQILGRTGSVVAKKRQLQFLDNTKTDVELAEEFGVAPTTVAHYRQNVIRPMRGCIGKHVVAMLTAQDALAHIGIRTEVIKKGGNTYLETAAKQKIYVSYTKARCLPKTHRGRPYYSLKVNKKGDYLAGVLVSTNDMFLIPTKKLPKTDRIRIVWPKPVSQASKWTEYYIGTGENPWT